MCHGFWPFLLVIFTHALPYLSFLLSSLPFGPFPLPPLHGFNFFCSINYVSFLFFFFLNPQSIISSRFSSSTSLFCNLTSLPFISILMIEPHEGIESAATPHWAYSICVLLPSFSQLGSSSQNTWQSIHHPFHFMPRVCRDSTLK